MAFDPNFYAIIKTEDKPFFEFTVAYIYLAMISARYFQWEIDNLIGPFLSVNNKPEVLIQGIVRFFFVCSIRFIH